MRWWSRSHKTAATWVDAPIRMNRMDQHIQGRLVVGPIHTLLAIVAYSCRAYNVPPCLSSYSFLDPDYSQIPRTLAIIKNRLHPALFDAVLFTQELPSVDSNNGFGNRSAERH